MALFQANSRDIPKGYFRLVGRLTACLQTFGQGRSSHLSTSWDTPNARRRQAPAPLQAPSSLGSRLSWLVATAMGSQWENFLHNLGEWHGSFASLDASGTIVESTPSILSLEQGEGQRLVQFKLRRFGNGLDSSPTREISQEYRSLGKQVVFFDSGTFCKGSLQVAPGTVFGAEFGFVAGDRRHRLVQLHSPEGAFESLVLIREFRVGRGASERPPLQDDHLLGHWTGQAATISADWPEPDLAPCALDVHRGSDGTLTFHTRIGAVEEPCGGQPEQLLLLPDSGYCLVPLQVSHREAFRVEAGWLPLPGKLERLIRRYDTSGAWISATWISAVLESPEAGAPRARG